MKRLFALNNQRNGYALILAYMVTVFFTILSWPLWNTVINERWGIERQRLERQAFYLAEGSIEDAINQFTNAIANSQIQPNVPRYPSSGEITTVYAVSSALPSGAQVNSVITEAESSIRQVSDTDGTAIGVKAYIVTSVCQHPANSNISVTLNQVIILRLVYTFQHAVFYAPDLELQPGPNMTLTGRIHSNNNIYIDCYDNGAIFTLDTEYLRSAGHIFHGRKIDRRHSQGKVKIKKAGTGSYKEMNPSAPLLNTPPYYDSESWPADEGSWVTDAPSRWNNTVKDSSHDVIALAVPAVASMATDGYYSQNAALYVYNDDVYTGLPPALGGTGVLLQEGSGVNDLPPGTITTTAQFKNNRENKFISMTDIDMQKLSGYVDDTDKSDGIPSRTPRLPANGLMYVTRDEDIPGGQQPGIRLKNGEEIERSAGLTVVSNDPIYVQGDYNTTAKKPAAIICDSLNILSNAWTNDVNSTKSVDTYRTASATTVNAAFIAGTETTVSGVSDGGGFQNYPRLHEKWTNIQLNITGSFVSLGESRVATGHYQWGPPQYYPPIRSWQWDSSFADYNNLPPFTPWAVEAERGAWWKN